MNNGAFGENFPYSNFHDLNMDWIIKIAKDFLDQYSNIQATISTGLDNLNETADELETALNAWYNEHSEDIAQELASALSSIATALSEAETAFNTEAQNIGSRVIASIPADYSELATSALRYRATVGDASAYNNRLANVNILAICAVNVTGGWTDLPTGFSAGIFINAKYTADFFCQIVIQYPSMTVYRRVVNATTGTVAVNWTKDSTDLENKSFLYLTDTIGPASGYSNKLQNVNKIGSFVVLTTQGWTDIPTGETAGIVLNIKYQTDYYLQILVGYPGLKTYKRVINPSNTTEVQWTTINYDDFFQYYSTVGPTSLYNNLISKVNKVGSFVVLNTHGWTDLPENEVGGVVCNFKYNPIYLLQVFTAYPSMRTYKRYIDTSSDDVIPWAHETSSCVWYALGDSITAGSYSTPDGQGIVATNAEWSYPNRIAKSIGCIVQNAGVPGAKISQFLTPAQATPTNATLVTIMGGINDYTDANAILGSISDTGTTTVIGALKAVIQAVYNRNPNARIVLITPLVAKYGALSDKYAINYRYHNFTLGELKTAIETVGEYYNLEVIDATTKCISMLNIGDALKDNVHPTKEYYQRVAEFIQSKLF